ncbi:8290_t:CDS:2 [Cetraspora pellucida]|uniref:8290_t:CDS:1 n=1 Tax=Cetraspora pellucida TaxID=1433469 RepID=A0A9N8ZIT0_9GLOM|nr:8290_t:CDS:2 [Cetraspora pellucida]
MRAITHPNDFTMPEIPISDDNILPFIIIGCVAIGSICIHFLVTFILRRVATNSGWTFDHEIVKHCSKQTLFMFPVVSILISTSFFPDVDPNIMNPIRHFLVISLIIFATWAAFGFVKASSITIARNHFFRSRKSQTQIIVTTRVAYGIVGLLSAACVILTFPQGWELGASLLASASVTALFIGLAAKPSLENLIASLQIALTQPLLLDDYVVIDGFAGTVEEIKSQYIVLRSLEERRFIIPLSRVTTYTFQNWSRTNESISTTFNLFVDYGIPLEDLRHQFFSLVEKNDRWDRRDASLNISEAKENSLMLAGTIEYIVTTYPQYLPRARSEHVPSRTGVDSMKKVVPKMDEAIIL